MPSIELSRGHPIHHGRLPGYFKLQLDHGQWFVNHIRKLPNLGARRIAARAFAEGKLKSFLDLPDDLDRHDIQVSEKFLYQRLQVCIKKKDLELGRQVHAFIKRCGQHSNTFLGSHVIRMLSCFGRLREAKHVFDALPKQNVFTWSAIISAFASFGQGFEAYALVKNMLQSELKPNAIVFVVSLKACASIQSLVIVKLLHVYAVDAGFESNSFVANTLIGMYASCGSIVDGCATFAGVSKQDVASWNAIIAAHLQCDNVQECFQLFQQMQNEGVKPNNITCVNIIKASSFSTLDQIKFFHIQMIEIGLELNNYVASSLIDAYAKQGTIDDAQDCFDMLPEKDVVTWSALMTGYIQNGHDRKALLLFQQMQLLGVKGDSYTFVSTLNACSTTAATDQGQLVHVCLIEDDLHLDVFLGSALIDMYAGHGRLQDAQSIFNSLLERDIGVWNAMVESCTTNNNHELAMYYFDGMQMENLMPDEVTFVCLLSMCTHTGLMDEGWYQLKSMIVQYGILPVVEHYNCLIDLLGRLGQLHEAENVLQNMPWQPTLKSWMSLLSNSKSYSNVAFGFYCFKHIFLLDCMHASAYTLMCTLFSGAGLYSDASKLAELRDKMQAWRKPGKAYIEVGQCLHEFVVGSKNHPSLHACYRKLKSLLLCHCSEGCMPELDLLNY
ncbi:hypothetical protein L7F22_032971 [Adiantum nelumboides]|nr:hypothetical protein [Adiantum nelumboides]